VKTLKILYFADLDLRLGGGQRRAYEVIKKVSYFHEVYVICIDDVYPPRIKNELPIIKQYVFSDAYKSLKMVETLNQNFTISKKLRGQFIDDIESIQPDLIVITGEWIFSLNILISKIKFLRYPITIIFHEPPIIRAINQWESILGKLFKMEVNCLKWNIFHPWKPITLYLDFHYSILALKKIYPICAGKASAYFLRKLGIKNALIIEPPNAVEHETIKMSTAKIEKSENPSIVFLSAFLSQEKGLYDFLKTYLLLKSKIPKLQAFIMGSVRDQKAAKTLKKLEKSNVKYLGFVSDDVKYKILASSWLLVYPSVIDAFSIAVLEALCCGTPAVVYDIPAFSLNYPTKAVLKVPYDWKEIAKKAYELLSDISILRKLSVIARNYASIYTWENVVKSELRAYEHIVRLMKYSSDDNIKR
jgi:glycosyltransferase involved in cell wall biosynthesis